MKRLFLLFLLISTYQCFSQIAKVSSGSIQHYQEFPSKHIRPHTFDVWLPDGYDSRKKYPVLYMNDGASLFDASITGAGQSWEMADVITKLITEEKINPFIIVAIWNAGIYRHSEYFPQKAIEQLSMEEQNKLYATKRENGKNAFIGKVYSDLYLKFIVEELKPFIDQEFSTKSNSSNTFIGGSSMGGLISLYALCEYPTIFSGAFCMSTHWPGIFSNIENPFPSAFQNYLTANLPESKNHRIYFDYGTKQSDSLYKPYQMQVDQIMISKGYEENDWITREFMDADHSINAWNKRVDIPLVFLFKK